MTSPGLIVDVFTCEDFADFGSHQTSRLTAIVHVSSTLDGAAAAAGQRNGKLGFSAARFSVPGFPFMIFHSTLFLLHLFPLYVFPFYVKMFLNEA